MKTEEIIKKLQYMASTNDNLDFLYIAAKRVKDLDIELIKVKKQKSTAERWCKNLSERLLKRGKE